MHLIYILLIVILIIVIIGLLGLFAYHQNELAKREKAFNKEYGIKYGKWD